MASEKPHGKFSSFMVNESVDAKKQVDSNMLHQEFKLDCSQKSEVDCGSEQITVNNEGSITVKKSDFLSSTKKLKDTL